MEQKKIIFITGIAGFIGYHLAYRLIEKRFKIIGLDNFNSYYDKDLKKARIQNLEKISKFNLNSLKVINGDLEDYDLLLRVFEQHKPNVVIHFAAQAGVRYSIENPKAYVKSNLVGFNNILECCRLFPIYNLLYASSSSVYGGNIKRPYSEKDPVNHPVSLYAATKKSNELMAHSYSHIFNIPATGLRFFTVYGPWGRPDMAPMIFAKAILEKKPIKIFNNGNMSRDFTYIDDVITSIIYLIDKPANADIYFDKEDPNPATSWSPHRILNIGNGSPVKLLDFVSCLESEIGMKAIKVYEEIQPGDVQNTHADTTKIDELIGIKEKTSLENGLRIFVKWFKEFYKFT